VFHCSLTLTVEDRAVPVFAVGVSELREPVGLGSGSTVARLDGTSTGWQEEEEEDGGEDPEAQGRIEADEGGEEPTRGTGTDPRSSRSVTETGSSPGLQQRDSQMQESGLLKGTFSATRQSNVYHTVAIEIILPSLQIWFISKMYRLSAVCNEQIKQKYFSQVTMMASVESYRPFCKM